MQTIRGVMRGLVRALKGKVNRVRALGNVPPAPAFSNSIGIKFALIPAGQFVMGSPEREPSRDVDEVQHVVKISRHFLMAVYHVTRGQFAAFVKDSGYRTESEKEGTARVWTGESFEDLNGASWCDAGFDQADDHPVVCVSWNDAVAFCQWLTGKEDRPYRLPTEAEWEYACRAGTTSAGCWGDDAGFVESWTRRFDSTFVFTAPVGSFRPNAWGLYDMNGNASQWCSDWYDDSFCNNAMGAADPARAVIDPTGPQEGATRVLRGASWYAGRSAWRAANRYNVPPDRRDSFIGFRLVLDC